MRDEKLRIHRFIKGLNLSLQGPVRLAFPTTFREVVEIALITEDIHTRQESRDRSHNRNPSQQTAQQKPSWKGDQSHSAGPSKGSQTQQKGQQDTRQRSSQGYQGLKPKQWQSQGPRRDQRPQSQYTQPARTQQSSRGGFSGSSRTGGQQQSRPQGVQIQTRGPCYACGGMGHIAREYPQGSTMGSQQGATSEPTIGDMGRSHRVFAAVDDRQAEHQAAGMIRGHEVTILFDSRATYSFIPHL